MIAVGCLSLVILPLLGLAAGGYLGGQQWALWGAVVGLSVALIICAGSGYALFQVGKRR